MEQKYKSTEQEEDSFDAGFKLPDTRSILERLERAEKAELQREHQEETEKEEKAGRKPKQRRGGSICFCENPNCRIGPFVERA